MRIGVILKYYLKGVLGRNLMIMVGVYSLFALGIPLMVAALVSTPDTISASDIFPSAVIYMCISAGIYVVQYGRMHIALGTTRKEVWAGQVVLGTAILGVATVVLSLSAQWLTTAIGNGLARLMGLSVRLGNATIQEIMFGGGPWGVRVLLPAAIAFALLAITQCITLLFQRWAKPMLLVSLCLGALFTWCALSHTEALARAMAGFFGGDKLMLAGKLALVGVAFLAASYIPLRRLTMKG
ncbi:MAG: hypothetical protein VB065_03485 [Eubacteriales bacterium]|nr:hypothetical protein [Christensenellaceae bacterium]MEA5065088.1 hypothetical protein [Eubacteriales bacterium]